MFLLKVRREMKITDKKSDEKYIDACIVCLNLLDIFNKIPSTQDIQIPINPIDILKTITKTGTELKNLNLEDKVQILKDNSKMIVWTEE